jgi:hypothetical protein
VKPGGLYIIEDVPDVQLSRIHQWLDDIASQGVISTTMGDSNYKAQGEKIIALRKTL